MSVDQEIHIRRAVAQDMKSVAALIKELASYEKAAEEAILTENDLVRDGFGAHAAFSCLVAVQDDIILGMAIYYERYSTWKGRTLYLEDLVVKEDARRKGIGKKLFRALREIALQGGYKRLEWQVLDWNAPAIAFYQKEKKCELDETWINGRINFV